MNLVGATGQDDCATLQVCTVLAFFVGAGLVVWTLRWPLKVSHGALMFRSPPWSCFAILKHAVDVVGKFDENFWPVYHEDYDYMVRMARAGLWQTLGQGLARTPNTSCLCKSFFVDNCSEALKYGSCVCKPLLLCTSFCRQLFTEGQNTCMHGRGRRHLEPPLTSFPRKTPPQPPSGRTQADEMCVSAHPCVLISGRGPVVVATRLGAAPRTTVLAAGQALVHPGGQGAARPGMVSRRWPSWEPGGRDSRGNSQRRTTPSPRTRSPQA